MSIYTALLTTMLILLGFYVIIKIANNICDHVYKLSFEERMAWRMKWEFRFIVVAAFVASFVFSMWLNRR